MYQGTDNITTREAHMATDTSTIRAGAEIFTLINVFSVAPDHQQELANVDSNAGRAMRTAACAGGLPWPHWPLPPRPSLSISSDPRGARLRQRTDGCRTRVRRGPECRRPHRATATTARRRP